MAAMTETTTNGTRHQRLAAARAAAHGDVPGHLLDACQLWASTMQVTWAAVQDVFGDAAKPELAMELAAEIIASGGQR